MSSKGQSTLISTALYIGIIVTATIGITTYMSPVVDDLTDSQTVQQMLDAMPQIEETIRSVAESGAGSQQTFSLSFRDGSFDIDSGDDELSFTIDSGAGIISPGASRSFGNVQLSAGATVDINGTTVNGTPCWQVSNTHISACIKRLDDPLRSLVGFYTLDAGTQRVSDGSGYDNTGLLGGGVGEQDQDPLHRDDCSFAGCFSFDGTDDHIAVPDSPSISPSEAVTVSAWVQKPQLTGEYSWIVRKAGNGGSCSGSPYFLGINNDDELTMAIDDTGYTTGYALTSEFTDGWQHVVGSYTGDRRLLYLNGDLVGNTSLAQGPVNDTDGNLAIGGLPCDQHWTGDIDHVAVYNHSMGPEEVSARYRTGTITQAYRQDFEPVVRYTNTDTGIEAADPELSAYVNANTSSRTGFISTSINEEGRDMAVGTVSVTTKSMTGIDYRTDYEVLSGADFLSVSVDED